MTVKISRAKEALFYLEADLEWISDRKLNSEAIAPFQKWLEDLSVGAPENLKGEIYDLQALHIPQVNALIKSLIDIQSRLQSEANGGRELVEETIAVTQIAVSDEVKKYLPEEEIIEPDEPIVKG